MHQQQLFTHSTQRSSAHCIPGAGPPHPQHQHQKLGHPCAAWTHSSCSARARTVFSALALAAAATERIGGPYSILPP
eukprot:1158689-Pelagomonas_calceolata.AAC.12